MPWNLLVQNTQILAIHAALLRTGEILYFSGDEHDKGQNEQGRIFHTRLFDCETLSVRLTSSPGSDVFCAGHSFLGDGRLMVTGGTEAFEDDVGGIHGAAHHFTGLRDSWIYDPDSRRWIQAAYLAPRVGSTIGGGRWYPTLTTLPDGRVTAMSGHPASGDFRGHNNDTPEVYSLSPGPWGMWMVYGREAWRTMDEYPRLHVMPDGNLFCLSAIEGRTKAFNPTVGYWLDLSEGPNPDYGGIGVTSVLLPLRHRDNFRATILACNHQRALLYDYTTRKWRQTAPRALAGQPERTDACAVLLPTGDVLVSGGTHPPDKSDLNGVREAELFHDDGAAGVWSVQATAAVVRNYHSVALLMPDGRVWTAGSNHDGGRSFPAPGVDNRELRVELFEPPYFGNPNRPVINKSPEQIACGGTFKIETPQAGNIEKVVIVRAGCVTHAFDGDQRLIELAFTPIGGNELRVTEPPNNNVAPPGHYLVFVVDRAGLPSVGKFTHVRVGQTMRGHVILFEHANFHGAHKHVFSDEPNLNAADDSFFNDRVSSIVVLSGNWEFFRHSNFGARYPVVLGPGLYESVSAVNIENDQMSSLRPTDARATVPASPVAEHAILFEHAHFHGAHKHVFRAEPNLNAADDNFFNDRTSSIVVMLGNWRFFKHANFVSPYMEPASAPPKPLLLGPALYPWVEDVQIRNDDMSSLRPERNERDEILGSPIEGHVMIFEHANFHGAHKHFFRAEPNLNAADDNFFNDRTSSVAVLKQHWGFFRHSGFVDQYPTLLGGAGTVYPRVQDAGIKNDDVSSLMPWPEVR